MQNIGTEFNLRVHSNRWGHKDSYKLTKTEKGWNLNTMKFRDVEGDTHGSPAIEKALTSESISYPNDIGYFLSDIWEASQLRSAQEIQSYFDVLGDWISNTEIQKPSFNPLHL